MQPIEQILTIPRSLFEQHGSFQGLHIGLDGYAPLMDPANHTFVPRPLAEEDFTLKQIIPYVLVHSEGKILRFVRTKKAGEARLHDKASIGFGGHVNDGDGSIVEGISREIHREELKLISEPVITQVALLNDDSNDVGRVHLGLVCIADVETQIARSEDTSISGLEFLTIDQLHAESDRLENWSQICLSRITELLQLLPSK